VEPNSLWSVARTGAISAKAIGLTSETFEGDWHEAARFLLPRPDFAIHLAEGSRSGFLIAVEIDASVDPKVVIGPGTVFEQLLPNTAQNLAVAGEWHYTIDAGEIVGAVLPAYCLNRHLPPPSGEALRVTPLAFAGDLANQNAVWTDTERRRRTLP
jgi:hypothetical protein